MSMLAADLIASPEPIEIARKADLRYISEKSKCLTRRKWGKGWQYVGVDGKQIRDKEVLDRIKALVIPPAWEDVWICPQSNGHIQAMGTDQKGRRQYVYHTDWTKACQETKFDKMLYFGDILPKIRYKVGRDMSIDGLSRLRVLATVVWLLEHTFIRVGNEEYAKENNHFGLTTLRNKHVQVQGDRVKFEFVGKSGVAHNVGVSHPMVVKTIKRCIELPGYELFQYVDEGRQRHSVDSADVNEYLHEISGAEVTAKEFRTWGGTVMGAVNLNEIGPFESETEAKRNVNGCVKKVASRLGNTPSVCRSYYIHPVVISTYNKGELVPHFEQTRPKITNHRGLNLDEAVVVELLKKYS